jgi:hypothetical protein
MRGEEQLGLRFACVLLLLLALVAFGGCGGADASRESGAAPEAPVRLSGGPYIATTAGPISVIGFFDETHYGLMGDCNASSCMERGTYEVSSDASTLTLVDAATGETRTLPLQVFPATSPTGPNGNVTPQGIVGGQPQLVASSGTQLAQPVKVARVGSQLVVPQCVDGNDSFEGKCKVCNAKGCVLFTCDGSGSCESCPLGGPGVCSTCDIHSGSCTRNGTTCDSNGHCTSSSPPTSG